MITADALYSYVDDPTFLDMFGGYTDVARYTLEAEIREGNQQNGAAGPGPLPPEYLPKWKAPDPWHLKGACSGDFVLIAEFSEQEGPKPLITIPRETGSRFELGDFAVRIMSVDNQAVASETFTLTEDTQVVLSENQYGIHAYVHHFTLYDCQARGFVRPFCMSYVCPDYSKLMSLYTTLTKEFSQVSHYFKYGSLLLFVKDLTHYLSDLQYTRERFLERERVVSNQKSDGESEDEMCDPSMILEPEDEVILNAVTLRSLDNMIQEVKGMLDTTSSLLTDKQLEAEFHQMEVLARDSDPATDTRSIMSSSLRESGFHINYKPRRRGRSGSFSEIDDLHKWNDEDEIYRPKLVKTSKKRFEKSLRTLHELCKWGAKEGINKLRNLHMDLSRDWATLHIERKEASLIEPGAGLLTVGKNITINMLSGLHQDIQAPVGPSGLLFSPTTPVPKSESMDTLSSFKSAESFLSCVDDESPVASRPMWDKTLQEKHSSSSGCGTFSTDILPKAESDVSSPRQSEPPRFMGSYGSQSSATEADSVSIVSDVSYTGMQLSGCSVELEAEDSSVFQKTLVTSIADQVSNWSAICPGYGILKFVSQCSFTPHLLYSLLCGRPLVIAGSYRAEKEICAIINSLAMFVPGHSSTKCAIVPFHVRALRLTDLLRFKILGLGRPDKKTLDNLLPSSLRNYISVLNLEKKTLVAPSYQAGVITDIYKKRKCFSSEQAYVLYVHGVILELAMKADLYYHCICQKYEKKDTERSKGPEEKAKMEKETNEFFAKIKVGSHDAHIIQYFAEVVKEQQQVGEDLMNYEEEDVLQSKLAASTVQCSVFKA